MGDFYCTTYCNKAHRRSDGKPLDHECVVLPPKALAAEIAGDYDTAIKLLGESRLRPHRGIRILGEVDDD